MKNVLRPFPKSALILLRLTTASSEKVWIGDDKIVISGKTM